MPRPMRRLGSVLLTTLVAVGLAACNGTTGPEGTGTASVQLAKLGGSSAALAAHVVQADPRFASVDLEDVAAIHVTVDTVEAHRVGGGDDGANGENGNGPPAQRGGWFAVEVTVDDPIDLTELSTTETLTIAEGALPEGDYNQLRLFLAGATVDFAEGVDPDGDGPLAEGATDVPLRIPSSEQTGVKIPGADFTVDAGTGTEVTVTFDENTSVQNLTITGAGEVIMSPVLTAGGGQAGA